MKNNRRAWNKRGWSNFCLEEIRKVGRIFSQVFKNLTQSPLLAQRNKPKIGNPFLSNSYQSIYCVAVNFRGEPFT